MQDHATDFASVEINLLMPLVVRERPKTEGGGYWIIAGERRWRASQRAGLREVPVVLRDSSRAKALEAALIDNIPYVATMAPVVSTLVGDLQAAGQDPNVLWWALALGADLGGNATLIGASANVVMAGAAAREGYPIRFLDFARYGIPVTVVTIAASAGYLWLRYIALGGTA